MGEVKLDLMCLCAIVGEKENKMADNMTYKSQKARDKAREYFGLGAGDDDFVLHHVDPTLRHTNPERYYEWRPEDLCIMTRAEHNRLHNIGNKNWEGKKHSEETKKKISTAKKGKNHTEETRKKISESLKGQIPWNKGKKHTEETKKKMSEVKKLPVEQYTLAGELVRVWESALQAEVEGGFNRSHIAAVCKGKRPHHKKYIWKYSQRKK